MQVPTVLPFLGSLKENAVAFLFRATNPVHPFLQSQALLTLPSFFLVPPITLPWSPQDAWVGEKVGEKVGDNVGPCEPSTGERVGDMLGMGDGIAVEKRLSILPPLPSTGERVGDKLGMGDGIAVGKRVSSLPPLPPPLPPTGERVGIVVGKRVPWPGLPPTGERVGDNVGIGDGFPVGNRVSGFSNFFAAIASRLSSLLRHSK